MNIFSRIFAELRLQAAIRIADRAYVATRRRFYVMPLFGVRHKLLVLDRKSFRLYRQKGCVNPRARIADLYRECFYCTPYGDGSAALTPAELSARHRTFLAWWRSR